MLLLFSLSLFAITIFGIYKLLTLSSKLQKYGNQIPPGPSPLPIIGNILMFRQTKESVKERLLRPWLYFEFFFKFSKYDKLYSALLPIVKGEREKEKLFNEIKFFSIVKDVDLTYNDNMNMKYLDDVVKETFRKYPALPPITSNTDPRNCIAVFGKHELSFVKMLKLYEGYITLLPTLVSAARVDPDSQDSAWYRMLK
ncbi:hypothetical protein PGB90_006841 [Kerria lacca]